MNNRDRLTLLGGLGLGAGIMYLLDPDGGGRRRALARDKAVHGARKGGEALRKTSTDVGNRTRGLMAQARSRFQSDEPDTQVLEARVRSKMGRLVTHPSAVHVMAEDGRVILTGDVLAAEHPGLLAGLRKVKGVHEVEDQMNVHESAGNVPSLQGEGKINGRFSVKPRTAAGLGLGALAGLGLLAGAKRRGPGRPQRPLKESRWVNRESSGRLDW